MIHVEEARVSKMKEGPQSKYKRFPGVSSFEEGFRPAMWKSLHWRLVWLDKRYVT